MSTAARIAGGSKERLTIGRLDIVRDWGWAPEYVEAMWLMLQQPRAEDFVIATGQANSLSDFVALAFTQFGLDWRDHTVSSAALHRPLDLAWSQGNPSKAARMLRWSPRYQMAAVVKKLCSEERADAPGSAAGQNV